MTRRVVKLLLVLLAVVGLLTILSVMWFASAGIGARRGPGLFETAVARTMRSAAIPRAARHLENPLVLTAEIAEEGLAHFADHCAVCHGNDGSGDTTFGRGMYPRPPDMRLQATQGLPDGELFYIIENGVKLTGMPAFGEGNPESEAASWGLVHFIRRLPKLTPEEIQRMEMLNPRPPKAAPKPHTHGDH